MFTLSQLRVFSILWVIIKTVELRNLKVNNGTFVISLSIHPCCCSRRALIIIDPKAPQGGGFETLHSPDSMEFY